METTRRDIDSRCMRCGERTHSTDECSFRRPVCFNCKESGHKSSDCPKPRNIGRLCDLCSDVGHVRARCPYKSWACKNCLELGHLTEECERPRKNWAQPNRAGRSKQATCGQCGRIHRAPECPIGNRRRTGQASPQSNKVPSPPPEKTIQCARCGQGHKTKNCRRRGKGSNDPARSTSNASTPAITPQDPCTSDNVSRQKEPSFVTIPVDHPRNPTPHAPRPTPQPEDPIPIPSSPAPTPRPGATPEQNKQRLSVQLKEKGNIAFKSENFSEAVNLYSRAIGLYDGEAIYFGNRAAAYIHLKRYRLALDDCSRALSLEAQNTTSKILVRVGRCHVALGDPASALDALCRALALNPEDGVAQAFKAKALKQQTDIQEFLSAKARNHWRMAETACASCVASVEQLQGEVPVEWRCWAIEIEIARERWDTGVELVERWMEQHPHSVGLTTLQTLLALLTGEVEAAKALADKALRLDPGSSKKQGLYDRIEAVETLKSSGRSSFEVGQWSQAINDWTKALDVVGGKPEEGNGGPMRAILLSNRALAHMKLNQDKAAMADIRAALVLKPNAFKALRTRARLQVRAEDFESAVQDFEEAILHATEQSVKNAIRAELRAAEAALEILRNKKQDHYEVLGIKRNANPAEIKRAYKTLSLKHHPDKGGNSERFKLIATAYAILSDPIERRLYDLEHREQADDSEFGTADEDIFGMDDSGYDDYAGGHFSSGPYAGGPYTSSAGGHYW